MSNDINLKLFAFNYADAPKSPLIKGEVEELIQLKQINIPPAEVRGRSSGSRRQFVVNFFVHKTKKFLQKRRIPQG